MPNYAPEKGKGHPPVMEAEAVAAMTCPGVPTHRKRLRPAERVETESADMQAPEAGHLPDCATQSTCYIGSPPSVKAGRNTDR